MKVRAWMFTVNNPQDECDDPKNWEGDEHKVKYCVWQKEKGEEGTEHYQGYLVFSGPQRLTWCKRLCARAHWEKRFGTHEQAKAYCTKPEGKIDGPWEYGEEPKGSGARTDLAGMKRMLDEGEPMKNVADEHFGSYLRYHRGMNNYLLLSKPKQRDWATETKVYWGPPGSGKTKRALYEAGEDSYWLAKPGNNQTVFFDGYDGQSTLVIDEFYGWISRDLMCRLSDRYPLNVQTKGGMVPFLAKTIIITSNAPPDSWWPRVGIGAYQRRIEGELGKVEKMDSGVWQTPEERDYELFPELEENPMFDQEIVDQLRQEEWEDAVVNPLLADEVFCEDFGDESEKEKIDEEDLPYDSDLEAYDNMAEVEMLKWMEATGLRNAEEDEENEKFDKEDQE